MNFELKDNISEFKQLCYNSVQILYVPKILTRPFSFLNQESIFHDCLEKSLKVLKEIYFAILSSNGYCFKEIYFTKKKKDLKSCIFIFLKILC